jgi:hypothetical protein
VVAKEELTVRHRIQPSHQDPYLIGHPLATEDRMKIITNHEDARVVVVGYGAKRIKRVHPAWKMKV